MFRPVQIPYFKEFWGGDSICSSEFFILYAISNIRDISLAAYNLLAISDPEITFFYMVAAYISETSQPWVSSQTASLG